MLEEGPAEPAAAFCKSDDAMVSLLWTEVLGRLKRLADGWTGGFSTGLPLVLVLLAVTEYPLERSWSGKRDDRASTIVVYI